MADVWVCFPSLFALIMKGWLEQSPREENIADRKDTKFECLKVEKKVIPGRHKQMKQLAMLKTSFNGRCLLRMNRSHVPKCTQPIRPNTGLKKTCLQHFKIFTFVNI